MTDLFLQTKGPATAPTSLLFMHGGMGLDHSYFRPYVDALGDEFQLVFYDHRLNGRSSRDNAESVDLETMAADAEAVAHDTCRGEVLVVAHSTGVWVALKLAERSPGLVSRMVLIAPGLSPTFGETLMSHAISRGSDEQRQALADAFAGRLTTDDEYARAWRTIVPLYLAPHTDGELGRGALRHVRFSLLAFQRFMAAAYGRMNYQSAIERFAGPVLFVAGADDWLERDPTMNSASLALLPTHSELATLDHCGHLPFVEQPAAFCETVRRWIHASTATRP